MTSVRDGGYLASIEQISRRINRQIDLYFETLENQLVVDSFTDFDERLPNALRTALVAAQLGLEDFRPSFSSAEGAPAFDVENHVIWSGYTDRNGKRVEISEGATDTSCLLSRRLMSARRAALQRTRVRFVEKAFSDLLQVSADGVTASVANTNLWIAGAQLRRSVDHRGMSDDLLSLVIQLSGDGSWKSHALDGTAAVFLPSEAIGRSGVAKQIGRLLTGVGVRKVDNAKSASWPQFEENVSPEFAEAAYDAWLTAVFSPGRKLRAQMPSLIGRLRELLKDSGLSQSAKSSYRRQLTRLMQSLGLERNDEPDVAPQFQSVELSKPFEQWVTFGLESHVLPGANVGLRASAERKSLGSVMLLSFQSTENLCLVAEKCIVSGSLFRSAIKKIRAWDETTSARITMIREEQARHAHLHGYRRIERDLNLQAFPFIKLFERAEADVRSGDAVWRPKAEYRDLDCSDWLVEPTGISPVLPTAVQLLLAQPLSDAELEKRYRELRNIARSLTKRLKVKINRELEENAVILAAVWGAGAMRGGLQRAYDQLNSELERDPRIRIAVFQRIVDDTKHGVESLQQEMAKSEIFLEESSPRAPFIRALTDKGRLDLARRILAVFFELSSNTYRNLPSDFARSESSRPIVQLQLVVRHEQLILNVRNDSSSEPPDSRTIGKSTVKHIKGLLEGSRRKRLGTFQIGFDKTSKEVVSSLSFNISEGALR